MRVIAGSARGIQLAPVPSNVRPTSDRVRESVFNALGQFFEGGEVLDLYAGTGALGIEALSRGVERAVFVEKDARAIATIRENLRRTGLTDRAEIVRGEAIRKLRTGPIKDRLFRLILLDPPYKIAQTEAKGVLEHSPALLSPEGRVVFESGDVPQSSRYGKRGDTRRYGRTSVTIFERSELIMRTAICPGSFDPVTNGHLDIIRRSTSIFDHVVIAVGSNLRKSPGLPASERARLIESVTDDLDNVSVEIMGGLLVDFARDQDARAIVKGLRAVSDFESEFEQAQLNRTLYPELETVFIMSAAEHSFLSSSAVREIAGLGGEVKSLVPETILQTVREKYSGFGAGETKSKG